MERARASARRPWFAVLAVVLALAAAGSRSAPVGEPDGADRLASAPGPAQPEPHTAGGDGPDPDLLAVLPPTHTVDGGETLGQIAHRYGVGTDNLAAANAVRNTNLVRPGRTLVLPRAEPSTPATPEEAMAAGLAVERLLEDVAAEFGWSAATVKAVAWRESRWTQRVRSTQGAIGVMQVLPATGEVVAEHLGRQLDLHDVEDNVTAGVAYLDLLHARYGGDLPAVLAAYHQGSRSVRDNGLLPITRAYIDDVTALRERFGR